MKFPCILNAVFSDINGLLLTKNKQCGKQCLYLRGLRIGIHTLKEILFCCHQSISGDWLHILEIANLVSL